MFRGSAARDWHANELARRAACNGNTGQHRCRNWNFAGLYRTRSLKKPPRLQSPPPLSPLKMQPTQTKKSYRKRVCSQCEQDEVSDHVSNQDNAQESLLSISKMLEDNATTLREKEEGRKMLFQREYMFDNLVLPSEQGPGVIHWKPDETALQRWKAYQTVSQLRLSVSLRHSQRPASHMKL